MDKAWSKYHRDCPYCAKKFKGHIIFKKDHTHDPVSERSDINTS